MARPRPPHILENILRAGEVAVIDGGYASVSIAAIARGAGIGVGSIYHYFADKDALLDWLVIRVLRPAMALPSELPLGPPPLSISEAVAQYLDVSVALSYLHEVSAREALDPMNVELRGVIGEFCGLVTRTDRVQTMVEVCSNDLEELRRAWYLDYRRALVGEDEQPRLNLLFEPIPAGDVVQRVQGVVVVRPVPSESGVSAGWMRRFSLSVPSMIPGWCIQSLSSPYSIDSIRSRSTPQAICCSRRDSVAPGHTRGPAENVTWRLTALRSRSSSNGQSNSSASTLAAP